MKLFFRQLEKLVDRIWAGVRTCLGWRRPAVIIPYLSYTNGRKARFIGRVVEDYRPNVFTEESGRFGYFVKVVRLFLTYDLGRAKIKATYRGQQYFFESDSEGLFSEQVEVVPTQADANFDSSSVVCFEVLDSNHPKIPPSGTLFHSRLVSSTENTDCLVISDIDDTILKSRATSLVRLVLRTLFSPIARRKTFDHTVELYQKLQRGWEGDRNNLFFYVSSSSWNIYDLLHSFITSNGFPEGPILLQELGGERDPRFKTGHEHKLDRIGEIADLHQGLPMLLIGDAGQQDPYIYLEVLRRYPGRVKAIFIRNPWWRPSADSFQALIDEAKSLGAVMVFFDEPAELDKYIEQLLRFQAVSSISQYTQL